MPYDNEGRHISDKEQFEINRTPRVSTGGQPDIIGNVYQIHANKPLTGRAARRANRFGRFTERPWRSRRMRGISMDPHRYDDKGRRILPVLSWLGRSA